MVKAIFASIMAGVAATGNHEWDCNCQGLYDVCSFTTCTYTTNCGGSELLTMPNVHNESESLSVQDGSNPWHCNCPGTYSWCSYTTCYMSCSTSLEDEEQPLKAVNSKEVALPQIEATKMELASPDVGNHEWDCNCQGLYDVCSFTTCTYTTNCGGSELLTMPNVHNESESLSTEAGSNPWHCNCPGTYSWCSYTTCYMSCSTSLEDEDQLALNSKEVALPQIEATKMELASPDVGNHEWDCNCQGLYDVCSFTTCTYTTNCGGSELLTMPNVHNETESLSTEAGSNPWHCNCPGTYSWCSYTTCYMSCSTSLEEEEEQLAKNSKQVALLQVEDTKLAVDVDNHEWDCNCQGLYDVCSFTTCTYTTNCGGSEVLTMPNVHNETESLSTEDGSNPWHCNCPGTYSWCSYTTCYMSCSTSLEEEEEPLKAENTKEIALPQVEDTKLAVDVDNHEWDCNCQGLYDVCSFTTCTYTTNCGGSELLTMPNVHNETESLSTEAGSNPWHCNCPGTYSWCSYTTCYMSCNSATDGDQAVLV